MQIWDGAGYLASGLVVAAFCMKDIVLLRAVALISNIAFLTYGVGLGLVPVWTLHAILLPINAWRLWQGLSGATAGWRRTRTSAPVNDTSPQQPALRPAAATSWLPG